MDRKNKVWLIVLIVLLILAVAGMVISRNQLADSQAQTAAVNAQLAEVQDSSAALQSDLDAAQSALTESQSQVEALSSELAAEQEKVAELEAAPALIEAKAAELEAALAEAQARIAELSAAAEPVAEQSVARVTKATQWRSVPGEEGQALADLDKGAQLIYLNQTSADALGKEWYCVELNGQTGWIPADSAELAAETETEPATEPVGAPEIAAEAEAIGQKLDDIVESDATDAEKLSEIASLEAQLTQTIEELTAVSTELEAQSAALADAESALNAKAAELEVANQTIAGLEAQISEITAKTEQESAARAELEAQLAAAQETCAAIEAELAAARAEYERRMAEMNAYLLSRDLIDGEAHVATSAASEIRVEADGVTAAFDYTNTSVSGNTVVLTIEKDGAEIYRSESIAPGESVSEIALTEALTAGVHDAAAVTTVYNEDGSVQLTSRVPVTLNVAE